MELKMPNEKTLYILNFLVTVLYTYTREKPCFKCSTLR